MSREVGGGRARSAVRRAAMAAVVAGTLLGGGVAVGVGTTAAGAAVRAGSGATEYYLALGDSLAAGVGSPDGRGYVADVYAKEHRRLGGLVLENLACSGATTTSMIDGGGCSYTTGTQLGDAEAFLAAHPGAVAFVTIDIGANDVDGCTNGTSINEACITAGMTAITNNLPVILSGLASAGGSTPILGMSYYDPFLAAWLQGASGQGLARASVTLLDQLNGLLAGDYGAAETADVADAFRSSDFALHGHTGGATVPVNVARICNWTLMCAEGNIHANDIGHAHIATAFERVLRPVVRG